MHKVDDYCRYLLNAITWIAKIEVPVEGVMSPPPPEF